jgi:hypothetical protein
MLGIENACSKDVRNAHRAAQSIVSHMVGAGDVHFRVAIKEQEINISVLHMGAASVAPSQGA